MQGNCWSKNTSSLAADIAAAHALLAKAEELLFLGRRPPASVAILAPRSATPWDDLCSLYDDTCIFGTRGNRTRENLGAFGKCCYTPGNIMDSTNADQQIRTVDYLAEVYGDYHALAQVHNIPVSWVDETAVATNASAAFRTLSTLVITEPNIPAAAVTPIIEFVRGGGHLVLICAAGALDEYNQPNPLLWQAMGLLHGDAGSTSPADYSSWAPASRMNIHVTGELSLAANGTGSAPGTADLTIAAYGRRCTSGLPSEAAVPSSVLGTFADGTTAVNSVAVGRGSVVHFAWLPGVSHLAAMEPSPRLPIPRTPEVISDASRWLAWAVSLGKRSYPPTSGTWAARVNVSLVETPLLLSEKGAVVTVLDWRPHNTATTQEPAGLMLNVTLPFAPVSVKSALHNAALQWVPQLPVISGSYTGLVLVVAPPNTHGADFISFYREGTEM